MAGQDSLLTLINIVSSPSACQHQRVKNYLDKHGATVLTRQYILLISGFGGMCLWPRESGLLFFHDAGMTSLSATAWSLCRCERGLWLPHTGSLHCDVVHSRDQVGASSRREGRAGNFVGAGVFKIWVKGWQGCGTSGMARILNTSGGKISKAKSASVGELALLCTVH